MSARGAMLAAAWGLACVAAAAGCAPAPGGVTCGAGTVQRDGACVGLGEICGEGTQPTGGGNCGPVRRDAGSVESGAGSPFADTTTWGASVRVRGAEATGESTVPQVAVDSRGNVYVGCMVDDGADAVALYRSTDAGRSFQRVATVSAREGTDGRVTNIPANVTVAVDAQDRVYWAWSSAYSPSFLSVAARVFAGVSEDGVAFSAPRQVSVDDDDTPFNHRPWLSLAPDGTVYLSWLVGGAVSLFGSDGQPGSRYARSTAGGPFGAEETVLAPGARRGHYINGPLAFDAAGSPVALARVVRESADGARAGELRAFRRVEGGAWADALVAPLAVGDGLDFDADPIAARGPSGAITATYIDARSRVLAPFVVRSDDGGAGWSAPARVADSPLGGASAVLPWATTDETGRVHVLWLAHQEGAWVPYVASTRDGATFGPPERVGDARFVDGTGRRRIGDFISIVARGGRRYAAWTDVREGTSQVYFTSAPLEP